MESYEIDKKSKKEKDLILPIMVGIVILAIVLSSFIFLPLFTSSDKNEKIMNESQIVDEMTQIYEVNENDLVMLINYNDMKDLCGSVHLKLENGDLLYPRTEKCEEGFEFDYINMGPDFNYRNSSVKVMYETNGDICDTRLLLVSAAQFHKICDVR